MRKEYDFSTREEAVDAASATFHRWHSEQPPTQTYNLMERTLSNKDGSIAIHYVEDETSGARAYILPNIGYGYSVAYLSSDEVEEANRTFPFRESREDIIPFAVMLSIIFYKPTTEIPLSEATSLDSANRIEKFFEEAEWQSREKVLSESKSVADCFYIEDEEVEGNKEEWPEEWERNIVYSAEIHRSILEEETGVKITSSATYIKALSKWLNTTLDSRQKRAVKSYYDFTQPYLFLRYALYEFLRSESYPHLRELLSHYADFGLSEKWEAKYFPKSRKGVASAEEYVIGKYLGGMGREYLGNNRLRDIAEFTETPYPLILMASRDRFINFEL